MDYFKTNLDQLHEQLRSGKLTSRQLVDETLAGIDKIDLEAAAFLAINADVPRSRQPQLTKPVSPMISRYPGCRSRLKITS